MSMTAKGPWKSYSPHNLEAVLDLLYAECSECVVSLRIPYYRCSFSLMTYKMGGKKEKTGNAPVADDTIITIR